MSLRNQLTGRRSFLTSLGALSGYALFAPESSTAAIPDETIANDNGTWNLAWLDTLKGKHKQVFDLGSRNLGATQNPLAVVRNYLNAHRDVYGLQGPMINTLVGITYSAFPMNATDAIWAKYKLGERWKIKDFETKDWAVRNVFALDEPPTDAGGSYSIPTLRSRGTIFWQCNNALGYVVSNLAEAASMPKDEVRAELLEGMMPGVRLVPAHTMLLGLAQERGVTYEKL